MKPLIWVEAIIGAGKTTFAREMARRLNLRCLEEPVDSNFLLEPFYKDPKKYAWSMQMLLLHRRYALQQLASLECSSIGCQNGAILDRSIAGDRVFAKLHVAAGNIDPLEFKVYEEAYDIMSCTLFPPTVLVYLDCQPETAYERMTQRGRHCEKGVPLSYLRELYDGYQELIRDAERGQTPWAHAVRVAHIHWDLDTVTPEKWDAVTRTLANTCGLQYNPIAVVGTKA